MQLSRATSNIPESDFDIQEHVLYVGERTYIINGRYKVWVTGSVKIDGRKLNEGSYQGVGTFELVTDKTGGVLFDRYPRPTKRGIRPAPVAPVIRNVTPEQRLEHRLELLQESYEEKRKSVTEEQILKEALDQLLQEADDDEGDMRIDETYAIVDLSVVDVEGEDPDSSRTESITQSPVDPDMPRSKENALEGLQKASQSEKAGVEGSSPPLNEKSA